MITLLMIYIDNKQSSQFITILSHNANWGTFLGERAPSLDTLSPQ